MLVRTIAFLVAALAVLSLFAARAHAASIGGGARAHGAVIPSLRKIAPAAPHLLTHALPPGPDQMKAKGIAGAVQTFLATLEPTMARATRWHQVERLPPTSLMLGVRPEGVSVLGASLATIGAGTGASMLLLRGPGSTLPMIGPRLFAGGGGIAFSMRW